MRRKTRLIFDLDDAKSSVEDRRCKTLGRESLELKTVAARCRSHARSLELRPIEGHRGGAAKGSDLLRLHLDAGRACCGLAEAGTNEGGLSSASLCHDRH